jgi:hypothetical protein
MALTFRRLKDDGSRFRRKKIFHSTYISVLADEEAMDITGSNFLIGRIYKR